MTNTRPDHHRPLRPRALAVALVLLVLAGATRAAADPIDVSVVNRDTGQVLRVWRHDGRLFVAGEPGARYGLRVTNNTNVRTLVVMSVDGVNVLTGETANTGQSGYVFNPYQSYDVNGWRKSGTEVAAFTFAPLPQSYAAETSRPGEVGVIGVATFREAPTSPPPPIAILPTPARRPQVHESPLPPVNAPPPPSIAIAPSPPAPPVVAPSARGDVVVTGQKREPALAETEKLGTAHGAREWSVANTVPFTRATPYPESVATIEYDTYDNLIRRGVIPPLWTPEHHPRPFPAQPDGIGYVPDPPGGR